MDTQAIDLAAFRGLEESAGKDFVAELARTFMQEAPAMIEQLIAAMADGKAETFRRVAHSLKSNSQTFGATRLGNLARDLELAGLERVIADDASAITTLAEEYGRVSAALVALIDA